MTAWGAPQDPIAWRPMGGEATLGEIAGAAFDAGRLAHSAIAESESIEQAFDQRIDAIRAATGQVLTNPYREALPGGVDPVGGGAEIYLGKVQDAWQQRLNTLAEKFPEAIDAIGPGRSIIDDANRIRREAEQRNAALMESRPGLGKYAAGMAGGFWASLRDPVQSSLLVLGGGPGAARTIGGRVVEQALVGAGTNMATELAVQPFVQDARAKAGLPSGAGPAAADIATAGVFGAVLGGGMQGIGEIVGSFARRLGVAPADLPADLRGATAAIEAAEALDAARPTTAAPDQHEAMAARALAAAEDPSRMEAIHGQATAEITGNTGEQRAAVAGADGAAGGGEGSALPGGTAGKPERAVSGGRRGLNDKPVSLFRFLAQAGGVQDHAGELRSMGMEKHVVGTAGRLVRKDGLDLDHAREIAAEAGYLDAKYGTPEQAMAQSTVADLLDLMSEEARGRRVYTLADQERMARPREPKDPRFEAHRRYVLGKLDASLPEAIRERTAELSHNKAMPIDDALERAIMEDYYAGVSDPATVLAGGQEHEAPFFNDHHDPRGNADQRDPFSEAGGGGRDPAQGGSGSASQDGGVAGVSGGEPGPTAGGASAELIDAATLPRAEPFEPASAADAQTKALLATIEDPEAVLIGDGLTLKAELDDIRHMEGMAGLVDACRLL